MVTKRVGLGIAAAVMLMMLAGCGNEALKDYGDAEDVSSNYPKEIENLMNKEYRESIKAVGQATSSDKISAVKKAKLAADAELARIFGQELAQLRRNFDEENTGTRTEHFDETVRDFSLFKLRGAMNVKEMIAQGRDGYTAFVLKVVSPQVIKEQIDEMQEAETAIKASAAYKELEARVEREKAARAAGSSSY